MKKTFDVLVLMHDFLLPKKRTSKRGRLHRDKTPWITEYDVLKAIKDLGHRPFPLGLGNDLDKINGAVRDLNPHLIFNMMENFKGDRLFESNLVSFLELQELPYTGCNPRGLSLARDKGLAKKILSYHNLATPKFCISLRGSSLQKKELKTLNFPLIVKCLTEESSFGLCKSSIVKNEKKLFERLNYVHHKLNSDAIIEEFIEGKELSIGVLGNSTLETLPICEVSFRKCSNPLKEIYTSLAKWNPAYQKKKGIKAKKARLSKEKEKEIKNMAKKCFIELQLNGYARLDLRMAENGQVYIIEVNPNPGITADCEFATAAKWAGITYPQLIQKILNLGLDWNPQGQKDAA